MAKLTVARSKVAEDTMFRKVAADNFVVMHGGVADYSGTPLYDGNDASRISFTDNAPALQRAFNTQPAPNGILRIYFPAGHYGFAGEGVVLNPTTRPDVTKVILCGDGDSTKLDYVKERTDVTSAQKDTASILLRITGIPVEIYDMHGKATTKLGVVHGSTDPSPENSSVYNGAVWFMHVQDALTVRTERVKISHCNYRGISVDAENLPIYFRTKWAIIDCEGFENTSTGYWGNFSTSMMVKGGSFYRNGTKGLLGTGYGVAASQYVDHVLIMDASFYENYRKGVDRHGGTGSLVVSNCTFADNLLRDIEDNKQYNAQYASTDLNDTVISNCTFLLNRNKAWLKEALAAVQAGGGSLSCFKSFVSVLDRLIAGTIANKQSRISFSGCTFKVLGNVPDGYQGFGAFNLEAMFTDFEGCNIDTTGFRFADGVKGNVYQSYFLSSVHPDAVVRMKNCSVKTHPGSITHPDSNEASNSIFLSGQTTTVLELHDTEIELTNFILMGVTGGGNVSANNSAVRKFYNSTVIYRNLRLRTQNQTTTNALTWVSSGYGHKGTSGKDVLQNSRVGFGDATVLAPLGLQNGMGSSQRFQINAASRAVGATVKLLLGVTNGNLHVTMAGALELYADTYAAGFRYSSWTQTVHKGSSYVAFERKGTEAIMWNGVATNFIATRFQVRWAAAAPSDTGYYNAEISCNDAYAPLLIG